jgi:hypothetical protein
MEYSWRVVVGDWSKDGHNESEFIRFKATHSREDIIKGYLKAHEIAGVGPCGPDRGSKILADYQDSSISESDLEKLAKIGLTREVLLESEHFDGDEDGPLTAWGESVAWLFLEMTRYGLAQFDEEFDYEIIPDKVTDCINGFWQSDFNHSMGYGVLGNW